MKVLRAKSSGFCWGVERAIQVAREQTQGGRRTVYTDGPLIHNNQMMTALGQEGVREVGDYQSSSAIELADEEREDSVVVVRAHGISPERRKYLKGLDMPFKDATCPDVGIIAGKVRMHAQKGYDVVIFGDPKHPEVIGLMGYAGEKGHAVQTRDGIDALPKFNNGVVMVSQSTMFTNEFERLSVGCMFNDCLHENEPDCAVKNALQSGDIAESRYISYLKLLNEVRKTKAY